MFDLVPTEENTGIVRKGDTITYQHNNVSDLSLYDDMCKIRKIPIDAIVPLGQSEIDDVQFEEPERMPGFVALFNEATGEVMPTCPVNEDYKLEPHDIVFHKQALQLQDSDLPINNVTVIDRLFENGLKAHRTVVFNDLQSEISGVKDLVRCRFDIFNSVNKSWAFQVFSGAYRDLCRNTLVFGGEKAYHQKKKHTVNLDTAAMTSKAIKGLSFWDTSRDVMKKWNNSPLSVQAFSDMLSETICKKTDKAAETGKTSAVNTKRLNYLLYRFDEERNELGRTLWAAYNALTHWSTHTSETYVLEDGKERTTSTKGAKAHQVERQREAMIRELTESDLWATFEKKPELVGGSL